MTRHQPAGSQPANIATFSDLLALEAARDAVWRCPTVGEDEPTRLAQEGAHDPTPTHYFILEELFAHFAFDEGSHLLDVGCGTGRVLAYFLQAGFPGQATGVELDRRLAGVAQAWTARHPNLHVVAGSALDLDLSAYTDFYLFNPFDPGVLQRFIEALEAQATRPVTLVHMSDNGDTWHYLGRPGWTQRAEGRIEFYRNARGYHVRVFDHPQHYSVWGFEPQL